MAPTALLMRSQVSFSIPVDSSEGSKWGKSSTKPNHTITVYLTPSGCCKSLHSGCADLSMVQAPKAFGFSGCQKGFRIGSHNCLLVSSLLDEYP